MITSRSTNSPHAYSRAKFKVDNVKAKLLFSNPLLFVSIYSKYHIDEHLKATVASMNRRYEDDHDQFRTVNVLVSGTLQRHCYWALSENLTHKKLAKVLRGLPTGLSLVDLAVALAKKFLPLAKSVENKYITDNLETYFSSMPSSNVKFIPWEKMIPGIIHDKSHDYGDYDTYYASLKEKLATDPSFEEAFQKTSNRLLEAKKRLIMKQGQTMRSLSPAMAHLTDSDLWTLASICSRNFLMEEAPLLFARLGDMDFTSIIYPAALTEAFTVTKELFSYKCPPEWVVIDIQEVKKSDGYTNSTEAAKTIIPVLQRSLSLGSLTVQTRTNDTTIYRSFFSKSRSATTTAHEEKTNNPPTSRKPAQVGPYSPEKPSHYNGSPSSSLGGFTSDNNSSPSLSPKRCR
jgi:hypothetical protein